MNQPELIQGRLIQAADILLIRELLTDHPDWHRTQLSRELCRRWPWTDAAGRLKDMACRTLLLKLEQRGWVRLPDRRNPGFNHRRGQSFQPVLPDRTPIGGPLAALLPVQLSIVDSGPDQRLWQSLLCSCHYLGFRTKVGRTLSYLARDRHGRPVGCLLFGAAAWQTAPRDRFIGWTAEQRQRHLHKVVNNMRFLVPPWVAVPHLASHLLGRALRRLPTDWRGKYAEPVVLAETFVDRSRFKGTCYQAAGWFHVGDTRGRSRNDVHHCLEVPVKAVYVRPLCRDFRHHLTAD
jgi:hypothetical protein